MQHDFVRTTFSEINFKLEDEKVPRVPKEILFRDLFLFPFFTTRETQRLVSCVIDKTDHPVHNISSPVIAYRRRTTFGRDWRSLMRQVKINDALLSSLPLPFPVATESSMQHAPPNTNFASLLIFSTDIVDARTITLISNENYNSSNSEIQNPIPILAIFTRCILCLRKVFVIIYRYVPILRIFLCAYMYDKQRNVGKILSFIVRHKLISREND